MNNEFYINVFINKNIAWACSHIACSGKLFCRNLSDTPHTLRRLPAERYAPCHAGFSMKRTIQGWILLLANSKMFVVEKKMELLNKYWYYDFGIGNILSKVRWKLGVFFHNKRNVLVMMFSKIDRNMNCHDILSLNYISTLKELRNIFEKHHCVRQQRKVCSLWKRFD